MSNIEHILTVILREYPPAVLDGIIVALVVDMQQSGRGW
jgi:hypothetical protein